MAQIGVNNIHIEYESYGEKEAPTVLFIMGLGAQLGVWPKALYKPLVDQGFRVVLFDKPGYRPIHKVLPFWHPQPCQVILRKNA